MHRVILPNAKLIDHKDMNGLNNQRSNISEVTKSENGINSRLRKDNQTGYRGIYPHKASGKFVVYGQSEAGGFGRYLGLYPDLASARLAQQAQGTPTKEQ